MCEHLCFALEVYFGVDVGCIDGDMTEPRSDGVDVDAGAEQMRGCRMPDRVRTNGSVQEGWMRSCCGADVIAKHPVDAMAGNRLAKSVEEDRLFGRAVAGESEQRSPSDWPEWATTCLVALAPKLNVADLAPPQVEIADLE